MNFMVGKGCLSRQHLAFSLKPLILQGLQEYKKWIYAIFMPNNWVYEGCDITRNKNRMWLKENLS